MSFVLQRLAICNLAIIDLLEQDTCGSMLAQVSMQMRVLALVFEPSYAHYIRDDAEYL